MDQKMLFDLLRQSQEKVKELEKQKENITGTGAAGGDMVTITVNGKGHVVSLTIAPELLKGDDAASLLEVLLSSAISDAMDKMNAAVQQYTLSQASSMMGGFNPGSL